MAETETVQEEVVILQWFDLSLLAWAVFFSGLLTIVTGGVGFYGAYHAKLTYMKVVLLLKWYSSDCIVQYTFILFMVCCLELGIGIYLATLEVDVLEQFWFEDTDTGYGRRESFQEYFQCCGWSSLTDSYPYPGGGSSLFCPNQHCFRAGPDVS